MSCMSDLHLRMMEARETGEVLTLDPWEYLSVLTYSYDQVFDEGWTEKQKLIGLTYEKCDENLTVLLDRISDEGMTVPVGCYMYDDGTTQQTNGHHRLLACLMLGEPIKVLVHAKDEYDVFRGTSGKDDEGTCHDWYMMVESDETYDKMDSTYDLVSEFRNLIASL